jgi:hypothetical protein
MAEIIQPEWMKDYEPKGNPKWHKGMPSPNPSGRPRGIVDKRTRVTQALMDDAPQIARVVIEAALAGDIQAAGLVLSRVAPAIRAQAEKVEFDFDAKASVSQQAEAVLRAVADGKVAPDVGRQILESISILYGIKQVSELEQRLTVLEEKAA